MTVMTVLDAEDTSADWPANLTSASASVDGRLTPEIVTGMPPGPAFGLTPVMTGLAIL